MTTLVQPEEGMFASHGQWLHPGSGWYGDEMNTPPAFAVTVHAGTMAWPSGTDPSTVALDHRHFRWTFRTIGQGIVGFGIGVAVLGQFPTHIMHDPLEVLGRELLAPHLIEHDRASLERPCLHRRDDEPLDQKRCQFMGIKPERFPEGAKSPDDTCGNRQPVLRWTQNHRSISRTVTWEPFRSGYHTRDTSRWPPDWRRSRPTAAPGSHD
jgi:hypothetical protein